MQILSHRGYWLKPGEKNTAGAFGRSFDLGFGTETDVRDFNGELVISHDIPTGAELRFEDFLDILDGRDLPLALNIKADGLGDLVARKMHQRGLSQWFTFDMSVPELVRQLDAGLPAFTRRSEYERSDLLYDSATGVWLDAFSSVWFDAPYIHSLLGDGKRVCVVSPELHGRPPEPFWNMLIDGGLLLTDMMVCTDVPETLQSLVRGFASMIKAVIFDMDGVLIDARDWHYDALNRALRLFGMEISRHDHLTTFDGLPTKKKLEMLTAVRGLPPVLHGFLNEMKQRYTMEIVAAQCKPSFSQQYALSRLHSEGFRLAVCSNSIRSSVDMMMERADLEQYLDFKISNQDVTHAKPHPEMYTTAINKLGFSPDDVLIVEDNENGVAAARAAGGNVLEVSGVEDVTYQNIMAMIVSINEAKA